MKQVDPKENRIVFFSPMSLESETEIHEATILTARALAAKKHNRVFVYTLKRKDGPKGLIIDDIRTQLGKATYRHYTYRQLWKYLPQAHQLIVDNKPSTLFFIALLVLMRKVHRKAILVQCLLPLYIAYPGSLRDHIHNIRYTSPFYGLLLHMAAKHHQVLNAEDKKRIHRASLIRTPSNDLFFRADKANQHANQKKTVVIVGSLSYQKGSDMLPLLLRQLQRKNLLEQMKFIIMGNGDMRDIIEKAAKKYKNVKYIPTMNTKKLIDTYSKANIYLSLSRHQTSLYPITEAMAVGLIPVVFRIPSLYSKRLKDVVHYAEAFDTKNIVSILQTLLKEKPERIKEESLRISQFAQRNYTIDGYIKKLENIFTS